MRFMFLFLHLLSKLPESQAHLLGLRYLYRRRVKGIINPQPQISIGKQVHSEQCTQSRESPADFRFKLQILQKQNGYQCCPNLSLYSIRTCTNESFNFQVLLNSLEEALNIPTLLVNRCNSGSCKGEVISQKDKGSFFFFVEIVDDSQPMRAFLSRIKPLQFNKSILNHMRVLSNLSILHNPIYRIIFQTSHKVMHQYDTILQKESNLHILCQTR
jgi:hypothetical protein